MKPRFFLLGALWLAAGAAHAQDVYRTYQNPRFGTVVSYPANLVAPQTKFKNGEGRKFVSRDGQIEVTAYAFRNASARSARGEMNRSISDWKRDTARLTYARNGLSWFVVSGYLGNDIFYEKTLLQNGVFHTLIWQYPTVLKRRLDASLSRSSASFRVAPRTQTRVPEPVFRARPTAAPRFSPKSRPTPQSRAIPRNPANGY